jgi:hypothetical protein
MSSIEKDRADIMLKMMQAEKLGVETDLAPFKLALEGQNARMKHIEALAKIEKGNESSGRQ